MEDSGILDVMNEIHLMALHLVFLPRIQVHLEKFQEAISRRPLRTEGNKTPLQLWISGQLLDPMWNQQNMNDPYPQCYNSTTTTMNIQVLLWKKKKYSPRLSTVLEDCTIWSSTFQEAPATIQTDTLCRSRACSRRNAMIIQNPHAKYGHNYMYNATAAEWWMSNNQTALYCVLFSE